ncbi:hypothetical protein CB1_001728001, partial [Camelus ferus]
MNSTDIQWSAILSWGYADNILRLKSKQSEPPVSFIQGSRQYQPARSRGWAYALSAGLSDFLAPALLPVSPGSGPAQHRTETALVLPTQRRLGARCWDTSVLLSSQRPLAFCHRVIFSAQSATFHTWFCLNGPAGGGSDLRLWTVNGDLVGHVHCRELICSVAFSNQPEGVSINVIAGGLENGIVRLWSTWDLKPVREITFPKSNKPIVSLTFSCDGHHLYTASSDGTVIAWCRKDQQRLKQPMFYSFLSSYAAGNDRKVCVYAAASLHAWHRVLAPPEYWALGSSEGLAAPRFSRSQGSQAAEELGVSDVVKVAQVCSRQDTAKACGGASGNRDLSSSGGLANGEGNGMKEGMSSNSTTSISQARKAVEQLKMEACMDRVK